MNQQTNPSKTVLTSYKRNKIINVSNLRLAGLCLYLPIILGSPNVALAAGDDAKSAETIKYEEEMIDLALPANFPLTQLITIVSNELKIKFLFDETKTAQKITLKCPEKVKRKSLLGILNSVLKIHSMAIVDADEKGWLKIIAAADVAKSTELRISSPNKLRTLDPAIGVTQVFAIKHVPMEKIEKVIDGFLTGGTAAQITYIKEQRLMIISDYASVITKIARIIELIDRPTAPVDYAVYRCIHVKSKDLAAQLMKYKPSDNTKVEIQIQERTNQLLFIGSAQQISIARRLAEMLDSDLNLIPRAYPLHNANAKDVDELTQNLLINGVNEHLYKSYVQPQNNILVITTTEMLHKKIKALADEFDRKVAEAESPVRFYKLENGDALEILKLISDIVGNTNTSARDSINNEKPVNRDGLENDARADIQGSKDNPRAEEREQAGAKEKASMGVTTIGKAMADSSLNNPEITEARLTANEATNTIIVVGSPAAHEFYKKLIEKADERRPQVLVQFLLITLDTSDSYNLGIEISGASGSGDNPKILNFSSFGLSTIDAATGGLAIKAGAGFNGAILSNDVADVVVRALKTNGRSKVISTPQLLVIDNAEGHIESTVGQPTTSINNSNTNTSTSFDGFEKAGTTIDVTPTIGEGDHLTLKYSIDLSSFSGEGAGGIPAPRQESKLSSEITIPDGHTILVGGLTQETMKDSVSKVPFLGDIPGLGKLFQSTSRSSNQSTLFVMIKPVILRDDLFRDLKYLSSESMAEAGVDEDFPLPEPVSMR